LSKKAEPEVFVFNTKPIKLSALPESEEATTKIDIKLKVLGGMLGSTVDDAIGELAFFYPENESLFKQFERTPELCYTDDTAIAIGFAESILNETNSVDLKRC
jgi:ADP-ribosylglycohydrolase